MAAYGRWLRKCEPEFGPGSLTIGGDILNVTNPATTLRPRTEPFAAVVPLMGVCALRAVFARDASSFGGGMRSLTSDDTGKGDVGGGLAGFG